MKAVILAGGGGSRLWPLSTPEKPKQFQKLISEKTLLEDAIDRLDFLEKKDIYIATSKDHSKIVQVLCPQIAKKNIILEPAIRDTAPCIGLAASMLEKQFPGTVMAVIYADHYIKDKKDFQQKLKIAEQIAEKEHTLNIIEITAREPNTNFGYVKIGKLIKKIKNTEIYGFEKFSEKPDLKTAKKFVKSGNYLWNSGIYVWKTNVILDQYKKFAPEIYQNLMEISEFNGIPNAKKVLENNYSSLKKISIDYAIMEKVPKNLVRIIKANFHLSDLGTWETIFQELSNSKNDNVTRGQIKLIDCKGCIVYADDGKKIAAIGLKDTIIIDSKNGLLITQKGHSHKIKEIQ